MKKKTEEEKVTSPCISICRTDPITGYCYGCARTEEEKIAWKKKETSVQWKKENISVLIQRMSGWQLETFKESYQCKVKTGISIFKKNQFSK